MDQLWGLDYSRAVGDVLSVYMWQQQVSKFKKYFHFEASDVSKLVLLAIMWKVISVQTYKLGKKLLPSRQTSSANIHRLTESVWLFLFYVISWFYSWNYLFLTMKHNMFSMPYFAWEDLSYRESEALLNKLSYFYFLRFSYHCYILANPLPLSKREEERYMIGTVIFHTLIMLFVGFVYSVRYLRIGLLLCFLYDSVSIPYEALKIAVYSEKLLKIPRKYAYHMFALYSLFWTFLTFYFFPTKILIYTLIVMLTRQDRPLVEVVTLLAVLLELYNFYQFKNIVVWIFKLFSADKRSKRFILFDFFQYRVPAVCDRLMDFDDQPYDVDMNDMGGRNNARALVQTVRCVMLLKRKLRKIREQKAQKEMKAGNSDNLDENQLLELAASADQNEAEAAALVEKLKYSSLDENEDNEDFQTDDAEADEPDQTVASQLLDNMIDESALCKPITYDPGKPRTVMTKSDQATTTASNANPMQSSIIGQNTVHPKEATTEPKKHLETVQIKSPSISLEHVSNSSIPATSVCTTTITLPCEAHSSFPSSKEPSNIKPSETESTIQERVKPKAADHKLDETIF